MTAWIGPVELVDLFEPQITFTGTPTALGLEPGQVTAMTEWWQAAQLKELVNNPQRRVTIGGVSGVLEPLYFSDPMLGPQTAWCLLQSFQLGQADQTHSLQGTAGLVPYTLGLTKIGDETQHQVVAVRSARDKGNDFGVTAQSVVVNPFWDEDATGSPFITDPGGSRFTREYDAAFPLDIAGTPASRQVSLYTAPFVSSVDQLAAVTLPPLPQAASPGSVPGWVSSRSTDARGYDRRQMREVYGPSHRVDFTTDLMLVNGLCRFWVGNKGLRPFLHCQNFAGGDWREPGTVQFGTTTDVLTGARLVRVSPDETTIALSVQGRGDVFVTLRRGERMLRVTQPAGTGLPTWSGVPPTSRLVSAQVAPAHFTNGLAGGTNPAVGTWAAPFATWAGDISHSWSGAVDAYEPDIRLRWAADVSTQSWSRAWRYQPFATLSTLGSVGLLSIYSQDGTAEVELYVDTDAKAKVRVHDTIELTSPVLSFSANDDIVLGLRYDGTTLTLSWRANSGVITTTSAAVSITASAFYDEAYVVDSTRWGDANWGDGNWGEITLYPSGVIDNDMVFEGPVTDAEFALLCTATKPLANLPSPMGRLRRYVPFDAAPIVTLAAPVAGRSVDPVTDTWGYEKAAAALSLDLDVVAFLARATTGDTAADQQAQAAAQNEQQVRVR